MEDQVITDEKANDIIEIYRSLGWIITALSPKLFNEFWGNDDGYSLLKFKSNVERLNKDKDNHFLVEKKEIFFKAAENFKEKNDKYNKHTGHFKKYFRFQAKKAAKKVYLSVMDLIVISPKSNH